MTVTDKFPFFGWSKTPLIPADDALFIFFFQFLPETGKREAILLSIISGASFQRYSSVAYTHLTLPTTSRV